MERIRRWSAWLCLAILCGCDADAPAESFTDMTESGIPWVHSSGDGTWGDDEHWTTEVLLSLGTIEGDTTQQFGTVGGVALVGDTVVVLDRQAQAIRLFTTDGSSVRSFGERGDGPGEFAYADGVVSTEPGVIHVLDARRPAVLEFSTDGLLIRSFPHVFGTDGGATGRLRVEDATYDWIFDFSDRDYSVPGSRGSVLRYRPIRVDHASSSVDTFPAVLFDRNDVGGASNPLDGGIHVAPTADPQQFWFVTGPEYQVALRTLDGDTLRILSLDDFDRVDVSAGIADSLRGIDPARAEGLPAEFPAIDFLVSDGEGHLLVFPHAAGIERRSLIDVFDEASGEYLGRVQLPIPLASFPLPVASEGRLVAAADGPFGTKQVVLLRIGAPR